MYPVAPVTSTGCSFDWAFGRFIARHEGYQRWPGVISKPIITSLLREKRRVHGGGGKFTMWPLCWARRIGDFRGFLTFLF